jgi:hypothetical protein
VFGFFGDFAPGVSQIREAVWRLRGHFLLISALWAPEGDENAGVFDEDGRQNGLQAGHGGASGRR